MKNKQVITCIGYYLINRSAGYRTGVIGKWHLGIGDGSTDWNTEISPTPLEVGFDVSFVIPSTNDRVPTVWLDGNRVHNWNKNDDPLRISNNRSKDSKKIGCQVARFPGCGLRVIKPPCKIFDTQTHDCFSWGSKVEGRRSKGKK